MALTDSLRTATIPAVLKRRAMTTPTFAPPTFAPPPFAMRRGSQRFSSARMGRNSLRSSGRRSSQRSLLSLRSSRQANARPSRTKAVLDSLLTSLIDGVDAVRGCVEEMKGQMPLDGAATSSRVNYYMDMEKHIKALERKIRTLEVHKDRIEEMRDEYILKLKLRDGAINLAQALSSQSSRAAKEKLQAVRAEQRDLLEDLCDIEEELETKLGVFHVRIMGLAGLGHGGSGGGKEGGKWGGSMSSGMGGDSYEVQLKLSSQKWKARCRIIRGQQAWQDEDIIFLGKVNDELYIKVLGIRRIHGNTLVGSVKCQTRQLFSFYPQNVTFAFPSSSHLRLNVSVHWSPVLGDDFLSTLCLPTLPCLVGGVGSKVTNLPSTVSHVEKLHLYPSEPLMMGLAPDTTVQQIRILTETDHDKDADQSGNSYGRKDVKTQKVTWRQRLRREISEDQDFVYLDRRSLQDPGTVEARMREYPGLEQLIGGEGGGGEGGGGEGGEGEDDSTTPTRKVPLPRGPGAGPGAGNLLTLSAALEAVLFALEEPLEQHSELRGLDRQLHRLETVLKGGRLTKAPSMTLSESQALDSFDFLGAEDVALLHRMSRVSFSGDSEEASSPTPFGFSKDSLQRKEGARGEAGEEEEDFGRPEVEGGTTGVRSVDVVLIQHLLHCEYLLQHLQSSGPLNVRLGSGLQRLQREGETVAELLNMAADFDNTPRLQQVLPDLYANTELIRFWRTVSKDNPLSVSYEQFAIALDSHFGQLLWEDCPEVANQVFAELLGRILDLDVEFCGAIESDMVVTVFQYATFFLDQGCAISVCMKEIARELSLIDGLRDTDLDSRKLLASHLYECGFNHGALLVAGLFLSEEDEAISSPAADYLSRFSEHSPWRNKAVSHYVELLEHSDQEVRVGACLALGQLQAKSAIPQLLYIAKSDFPSVRHAASTTLSHFGEAPLPLASQVRVPGENSSPAPSPTAPEFRQRRKKPLQRAKSADFPLADKS